MMAICVDDEHLALNDIIRTVKKCEDITEVVGFNNASEALAYINDHEFDIAFLDIELGGIFGHELAQEILKIHPKCSIIFISEFEKYAKDVINLHLKSDFVSYLIKPILVEELQREVAQIKAMKSSMPVLYVKNRKIYDTNMKLVEFSRTRASKLLVYLVEHSDRAFSTIELCQILYDDGHVDTNRKHSVWTIINELNKKLKEVGAEEVLCKNADGYYIDRSRIGIE